MHPTVGRFRIDALLKLNLIKCCADLREFHLEDIHVHLLLQVHIVWNDLGYEQRLVAHNNPKHAERMQITAAACRRGFVHMYDGMNPHRFLL